MSRTYRKNLIYSSYFRFPKTFNEIRQISGILHDTQCDEEYSLIDGQNRLHRRKNIPTSWEDQPISAYFEYGKRMR